MEAWISLIGNVGFPITVSLYLLFRMEGKLQELTNSINVLSTVINNISQN